jgi:hypothetical protein
LVAAGLAALLNPVFVVGLSLILFWTGVFRVSQRELDDRFVVILGAVVGCIPEAMWGLVFGAMFAAFGKGGRLAGAISGGVFWFFLFGVMFAAFEIQHWSRFHEWPLFHSVEWEYSVPSERSVLPSVWTPASEGQNREGPARLKLRNPDEFGLPVAVYVKEICTGLIVGYVLGRKAEVSRIVSR